VAVSLLGSQFTVSAPSGETSAAGKFAIGGAMRALLNRFVREEAGQDLIEYGLLLGIITAVTVAVITSIGQKTKKFYDDLLALLP
jgi:Flp pilus assembly pilin Flp